MRPTSVGKSDKFCWNCQDGLTICALSKVLHESPFRYRRFNPRPLCVGLLFNRPSDEGIQPLLRDDARLPDLVRFQLRNGPEVPKTSPLSNDTLRKLKCLSKAPEFVIRRTALGTHFRLSGLRQRQGQRVEVLAEQELRGAIEREAREEVLSVARCPVCGYLREELECECRVLLKGLEVGYTLAGEEGPSSDTVLQYSHLPLVGGDACGVNNTHHLPFLINVASRSVRNCIKYA